MHLYPHNGINGIDKLLTLPVIHSCEPMLEREVDKHAAVVDLFKIGELVAQQFPGINIVLHDSAFGTVNDCILFFVTEKQPTTDDCGTKVFTSTQMLL